MSDRADRIEALYAQVPPIPDCKGRCWISCGPADIFPWERRRLAAAGHKITPDATARLAIRDFWCEALGPDGKCMAYPIRPLICRLWGAVEWLSCPHSCQPEGGWMPDADAIRLLYEMTRLGGAGIPVTEEDLAWLDDPVKVTAVAAAFAARERGEIDRFHAYGTKLPIAITSRKGQGTCRK